MLIVREDELLLHIIYRAVWTALVLELVVVVEMFVCHVVGQSLWPDGLEGTEGTVQSVGQSVSGHTALDLGGVAAELTAVNHPRLSRLFHLLPWWREKVLGVF